MYASSTGTTLSVVDLAELGGTVEGKLGAFGSDLTTQLTSNNYQSVATARNGSREFSPSARLDQVDLVDFCTNLNTKESKSLASAIRSAVKYNRVNGISNAYGLSIYFPNSSLKSVNSMIQICEDIGVDSEWTEGIRTYATLEQSGQIVANNGYSYGSGSGSLLDILLGSGSSGNGSYNYTSGSGSSGGGGSFLNSLFQDASSGSYSSSSDTGSLLEALLGIPEEDACKDYELTSFGGQLRSRNSTSFLSLYDKIQVYSGSNLQEKVKNIFLKNGITKEEIAEFKSLMLE